MSLADKAGIVVTSNGVDIAVSIHRRYPGYFRGNNEFCTILIDPETASRLGESLITISKDVQ